MKRISLFILFATFTVAYMSAYHKTSNFTNYPNLNIDIKQYSSTNGFEIINTIIGDTVSITFDAPVYGKNRIELELIEPDTIWVKRVKNPKLNKHYYLSYAYKGKHMPYHKNPDGSQYFQNTSFNSVKFIIESVELNDELGRTCIKLKELSTMRTIIWHVENEVTISDLTLQNQVNNYVKNNPLYYEKRETDGDFRNNVMKSSSVNAFFEFTFYASEYSYPNAYDIRVKENNSRLLVAVRENEQSKEDTAHLYIYSGIKQGASYKFIEKDEAIRLEQQRLKDIPLDSTFFLPIILDGLVYDLLDKKMVDLSSRIGYIYAAEPYLSSYRYYLYCNGKKIKFESYNLKDVDADKLSFLQRRRNEGIELRERTAIIKDKEQQEVVKAQKEAFIDKKIFLAGIRLAKGKYYQCGVDLKIFNCYNKTIKYIDFTVAAYNKFGDLQKDEIGNSKKSGRCIGPVSTKEITHFTFNELFFDKNEIITSFKIQSIKITFVDNTTIMFSGWENIKTHYQIAMF
jgi:hypothetical protein